MIFLSDNQHHQPQQFNKPSQPSPQVTRGHQPVQQHVQQQHVQQQHVQQQNVQQSKPMNQVFLSSIICLRFSSLHKC